MEQENEIEIQQPGQPPVVVSKRLLYFDKDGQPAVRTTNLQNVDRKIVDDVNFCAMFLPYIGEKKTKVDEETGETITSYDIPEEFEGLTNLEVASIKAARQAASGDFTTFNRLIERFAGKAVEKNLNINTSGSYRDYLEALSRNNQAGTKLNSEISANDIRNLL